MTEQVVYSAGGVSRYCGKSESWGHLVFARGDLPTELRLNGKQPMVTAATLKRLAPTLLSRRNGRPKKRAN